MASEKDPPRQSEREKSDETLGDSDLASEHQADFDRDAERVEADQAKVQSRSDSDASRDLGRADMGRSGATRQAEGDERLRVERQTSDQAIKGERLRADAATEKGRSHHQASAKSSAQLLSQEQASHQKTKAALTTREELIMPQIVGSSNGLKPRVVSEFESTIHAVIKKRKLYVTRNHSIPGRRMGRNEMPWRLLIDPAGRKPNAR